MIPRLEPCSSELEIVCCKYFFVDDDDAISYLLRFNMESNSSMNITEGYMKIIYIEQENIDIMDPLPAWLRLRQTTFSPNFLLLQSKFCHFNSTLKIKNMHVPIYS